MKSQEVQEKEPIDHCLIPYSGSGEYMLNISQYGISSITLNEFVYDLSNTELDFQYYNDIYLNDSRIKEIDINSILIMRT